MEDEVEFEFTEKHKKIAIAIGFILASLLLLTQVYMAGMIKACENSGAKLMEDKSCWVMGEGENICYKGPMFNPEARIMELPEVNLE